MQHHTHTTGDIAVLATMVELTKQGWVVYRPVTAEFLPFDLLASKTDANGQLVFRRFQVKSSDSADRRKYAPDEFDYFALHLKSKDMVVFIPLSLMDSTGQNLLTVATTKPQSSTPVWWYEDFLKPVLKTRVPRTYKDFGTVLKVTVTEKVKKGRARRHKERAIKVSDTQLKRLVWKKTMTEVAKEFGVSDVAVKKECKKRGIETPPRGYWQRRGKQ